MTDQVITTQVAPTEVNPFMNLLSIDSASARLAEKDISIPPGTLRKFAREGRLNGAIQYAGLWWIPVETLFDAEGKPLLKQRKRGWPQGRKRGPRTKKYKSLGS